VFSVCVADVRARACCLMIMMLVVSCRALVAVVCSTVLRFTLLVRLVPFDSRVHQQAECRRSNTQMQATGSKHSERYHVANSKRSILMNDPTVYKRNSNLLKSTLFLRTHLCCEAHTLHVQSCVCTSKAQCKHVMRIARCCCCYKRTRIAVCRKETPNM
jgi:hypothetical protein